MGLREDGTAGSKRRWNDDCQKLPIERHVKEGQNESMR